MQITIINGIPNENYGEYERALEALVLSLSVEHTVHLFTPRKMKIAYCCGCFGCWVKTPGRCVFQDDMESILKSLSNTDFAIYVSPLKAGFVTAVTKKVMDRFIPTALPYIRIYDGECHHPHRYDRDNRLGLVILKEEGLDPEAVKVTGDIFSRLALNMHAKKFLNVTVTPEELGGLKDEISRG